MAFFCHLSMKKIALSSRLIVAALIDNILRSEVTDLSFLLLCLLSMEHQSPYSHSVLVPETLKPWACSTKKQSACTVKHTILRCLNVCIFLRTEVQGQHCLWYIDKVSRLGRRSNKAGIRKSWTQRNPYLTSFVQLQHTSKMLNTLVLGGVIQMC